VIAQRLHKLQLKAHTFISDSKPSAINCNLVNNTHFRELASVVESCADEQVKKIKQPHTTSWSCKSSADDLRACRAIASRAEIDGATQGQSGDYPKDGDQCCF